MFKEMIEIRWHGRGGQGTKTAALLFAEVSLGIGKYIQAFPEYGPERMGAPVQAFNRISNYPITIHSGITNPDYVVVLDSSIIDSVSIDAGIYYSSKIIVNTSLSVMEISKQININPEQLYVVNATKIALEFIGRNIPNMPMFGALTKIINILDINDVLSIVERKIIKKFRHKPEVIKGNLISIKRAFDEVKN
ncbi:MAG: 2-oxoacid:acceptor oxidoreductase family protein [Endomicrobium sp.]|jgi:pyruvate ferredoxin oxidoreductase gamma subunit|nr:2-oxoacid:acceptor oxidoreductase family protein [Endomicrobium sp.]